jgi:hypothetical protein
VPRKRDLLLMSTVGVLCNVGVAVFTVSNGMWPLLPVNVMAALTCAGSFELVRRRYHDD